MDKSPYSLLLSNHREEINNVKKSFNNNDNLMEKLNYIFIY